MITNNTFEIYYQLSSKALYTYSPNTTLLVIGLMSSDEEVLKMEQILSTSPTEKELLEMIEKEFNLK